VHSDLVGDRFVKEPGGWWRDVATGDAVRVGLHALPANWRRLEGRLAHQLHAPAIASTLIDFGAAGRHRWFEARAPMAAIRPQPHVALAAGRFAEEVAAEAVAPCRGVRMVRRPHPPAVSPAVLAGQIARRLRPLGFVTLRAGVGLTADLGESLLHRHVVLLLVDPVDREQAPGWIRRLAGTSPRAHLIVDILSEPRLIDVVHEAHVAFHEARPQPLVTSREGHAPTGSRGQIERALTRLAAGDLLDAESRLAALVAGAESLGEPVDPDVELAVAELRFWQGRFGEADCLYAGAARTARLRSPLMPAVVLGGLIAWAIGDQEGLARAARATAATSRSRADGWSRALAALSRSLRGERCLVRRTLGVGTASGLDIARAPALVRAMAAEALGGSGDAGAARALLTPVPGDATDEPALYLRLLDWLRQPHGTAGACLDSLNRAGAHGVRRWGNFAMHLLHALPAMLQFVHDAEDDLAALSGCCAWLCRHSMAEAAAFVAADGQLIAAEGCRASSLGADLLSEALTVRMPRRIGQGPPILAAAPVRYAGRQLGAAIVRGSGPADVVFIQAAATLAALGAPALGARLDALASARDSQSAAPEILGRSPAIAALRDALVRAAGAPFPVLIDGESGTGKELAARALHRLSARRDRRFLAINCAALGDELVEAELFGHARGAFTGAIGPRAGLFEEAHGGTLMLDEVAELSARAQAKLLRVLQEREVRRVGENASRPVDVRLIAATNRPLGELASRGLFREDLLFRLAVIRLRLPPLRERLEDVPPLADAFWRALARQAGTRAALGADALAALCRHPWPGNVRELQNVVAALVVDAPARGRVGARAVARVLSSATPHAEPMPIRLGAARLACERETVASALARHSGCRAAAARDLGLTRQGLAKAIRRLGLGVAEPTLQDRAGVA
jgi:DNA-binding NtrC family response regulator